MIGQSMLAKRAHHFIGERCEECGGAVSLGVHHMDNDRTNNSPNNLRTFCNVCHTRWHWNHGKEPWRRHPPTCTVCGKPAKRSGLCETHRTRLKRHGSPYLKKIKVGHSWQLQKVTG